MLLACEDSPKLCTGQKAVRLGLAHKVDLRSMPSRGAILLDPFVPRPLVRSEAARVTRSGLLVVDCSWNRLSVKSEYPGVGGALRRYRERRRLPILFAANPQHYGRATQLNTAEALGASLYLLYGPEAAQEFFERFSFGPSFLALNGELLAEYWAAESEKDLLDRERSLFSREPSGASGITPRSRSRA